ncbi:MAG TPA: PilZ domain-containing protein [Terriglobales bacterium]|nr:PilZ domain-containing protein [Terriglobales bacterium]
MSPTDPSNPAQGERRRYLRQKVAAEVRLQLEKHATPLRAQTADISLGGCYVEMMFTLEVGTKIKLTLWLQEAKVDVEGTVVTRDLQVGNGIQFTNMSAEDSARLKHFLSTVP